jgi:hypothetical protein
MRRPKRKANPTWAPHADLNAAVIAEMAAARALGHTALTQGGSLECYRCGASGTFHPGPSGAERVGDIFTRRCR